MPLRKRTTEQKSLRDRLLTLCEQARELEVGQGRQPVTKACDDLNSKHNKASIKLCILTLDDDAATAIGDCLLQTPSNIDADRLSLHIASEDLGKLPFNQASSTDLYGNEGLQQKFCASGNVLLIAFSRGGNLRHTKLIRDISGKFVAIGLLEFELACDAESEPGDDRFSTLQEIVDSHSGIAIPSIRFSKANEAWHTQLAPELPSAIQLAEVRDDAAAVARAVLARAEREQDHWNTLLANLPKDPQGKGNRPTLARKDDKRSDAIKREATQALSELEERLALENERLIQPLGGLNHLVKEHALRISEVDLSRAVTPQAVRLRLSSNRVANYNSKLIDALQGHLQSELRQIDEELTELESEISKQFSETYGVVHDCELPRMSSRRVWVRIENLIDVGEEAEIELNKRSIFDVIGAGRQKVFFLIMFVALLGRMGIDQQVFFDLLPAGESVAGWLKAGFMVVLLTTCVGAMLNAVLGWREEKEEQTRKELTRIRESLVNDARKVLSQAQKEKRSVFNTFFKEVSEEAHSWIQSNADAASRMQEEQAALQESQSKIKRTNWEQRLEKLNAIAAETQNFVEFIGSAKVELTEPTPPKRISGSVSSSSRRSSISKPDDPAKLKVDQASTEATTPRNRSCVQNKTSRVADDKNSSDGSTDSHSRTSKPDRSSDRRTSASKSAAEKKPRPKLQSKFAQRRAERAAQKT